MFFFHFFRASGYSDFHKGRIGQLTERTATVSNTSTNFSPAILRRVSRVLLVTLLKGICLYTSRYVLCLYSWKIFPFDWAAVDWRQDLIYLWHYEDAKLQAWRHDWRLIKYGLRKMGRNYFGCERRRKSTRLWLNVKLSLTKHVMLIWLYQFSCK